MRLFLICFTKAELCSQTIDYRFNGMAKNRVQGLSSDRTVNAVCDFTCE
jgi:hypothetical protein